MRTAASWRVSRTENGADGEIARDRGEIGMTAIAVEAVESFLPKIGFCVRFQRQPGGIALPDGGLVVPAKCPGHAAFLVASCSCHGGNLAIGDRLARWAMRWHFTSGIGKAHLFD